MLTVVLIILMFFLIEDSNTYSFNPRITYGSPTYPTEYPFMISIQFGLPPIWSFRHHCAGVILSAYWLLTAAHCITPRPKFQKMKIKVGKYYTRSDDHYVQNAKIAKKILHEKYDRSSRLPTHDIALIKLRRPLVFTNHVQPVKLPEYRIEQTRILTMIGWGYTLVGNTLEVPLFLQSTTVNIIDNRYCQFMLNQANETAILDESEMCVHYPWMPITSCFGDSGGPLIRYQNSEPEIIGIMSWTLLPCGQIGAPTISGRILYFNEWIKAKMKLN